MNQGLQKQFGCFEKLSFCTFDQPTMPSSKKKSQQIHEVANQVAHREQHNLQMKVMNHRGCCGLRLGAFR
jgi:hypothetical protein